MLDRRIRRNLIVLTAAFLISLAVAFARSHPTSPEESSKLIALENAWNQAQLRHDARSLDGLVGDDFVYTDTDGTVMNKAQFLADIADTGYHATLMANEDVKVYSYPNTAVVTGTYHAKGTSKGKPFDHYGRFTDTWIYLDGMWQCVASHTTLGHK
jgi:ketosteroid isomerase-like protein